MHNYKTHDEVMIEMIKKDPKFATNLLETALEEATDEEGQAVLLRVLKQIAEAQGIAKVAKKAGIPRESLYRAFSEKGNPRLNTLFPVVNAMGYRLSLHTL